MLCNQESFRNSPSTSPKAHMWTSKVTAKVHFLFRCLPPPQKKKKTETSHNCEKEDESLSRSSVANQGYLSPGTFTAGGSLPVELKSKERASVLVTGERRKSSSGDGISFCEKENNIVNNETQLIESSDCKAKGDKIKGSLL